MLFRGKLLGKLPGICPEKAFLLHPPHERSDPTMLFVSLADACRHLGVDAKTLHRWLADAEVSLQCHSCDSAKKRVSQKHRQMLTHLHHRHLAGCEAPVPAQLSCEIPALPADLLKLPEQ